MAFSTPYASAAVVTETAAYEGGKAVTTQDTAWWSVFSDFYRVSGDFDVTFELTNKSDQAANWDNAVIVLSNGVDYAEGDPNKISGYKEYMVMRIDNWCWSTTEANVTVEGNDVVKECDWNFDTFASVMADAKINLNIKRTGNDFAVTMVVDGADGKTYHQSYKFTTEADKDMNIFFSGEKADVSILSYTVNGGTANTPETSDTTTGGAIDTTTGGAIDTTPGTTEPTKPDNTEPTTPDTTEPTTPDTEEPEDSEPAVTKKAALNKKKATVKVGKSVKLKVKNTTKKVTWSSSDKKVAKVNKSGKVTGVKAGKAVIKAKVGKKTLKCNVTVK